MAEFNVITAKEPRKITEDSNFYIKTIYKWIREAATNNFHVFPLTIVDIDPVIVESILAELEENGYSISKEDEECYMISW